MIAVSLSSVHEPAGSVCLNDASHVIRETAAADTKILRPAGCEDDGEAQYHAEFEKAQFEPQTKTEAIPAIGHDWNEPNYFWSEDSSSVRAERICRNDGSHKDEETVTTAVTEQAATCTEDGLRTWTAEFTGSQFEKQTRSEAIPATGHDWGDPAYDWSEDNSSVSAERICRNDSSHKETETAATVITEKAPTCTEDGLRTWTAEFENTGFETQKRKEVIPATGHDWGNPTYSWSSDNSRVTAKRVCRNDSSHVETETVRTTERTVKEPTETESGIVEYTAKFTNPAFKMQTRRETIPPKGTGIWYYCAAGQQASWSKGSGTMLNITYRRSVQDGLTYSHFREVIVDGAILDHSKYRTESGSLIIHLLPEYLETLPLGVHTLYAVFDDGGSEEVRFTITNSAQKTRAVNTEDRTNTGPWAAVFAGSLILFAYSLVTLMHNRQY